MTSYEEMLRGAIYLPPSATKIFFAFDLAIRKRGKIPPGWPADNPTISERDWREEIVALLVHDLPDWSDHDLRRQALPLIKHASKHWVGTMILPSCFAGFTISALSVSTCHPAMILKYCPRPYGCASVSYVSA